MVLAMFLVLTTTNTIIISDLFITDNSRFVVPCIYILHMFKDCAVF